MATTLVRQFLLVGFAGISLLCACSKHYDQAAREGTVNSSATFPSTNDTLRVNQPRAYEKAPPVSATGTNLQLAEAAGASASGSEGALAERVKTTLQSDTNLGPLMNGIKVRADRGKVILTGVVQTEAQKQSFFERAREIAGEDKVVNRIQVQTSNDLTPSPDVQKNQNP